MGNNLSKVQQTLKYEDFEVIDELEGGAQGRTFYVKLKETGVPYAMKRINYMKIEDKEKAEKEIAQMKKLESKFTVRLVYTFQDRTDMFLVMQYCEKGDLRKVITELQSLPEEERVMRVWAIFGQMIRSLNHLHSNGVIHRDIKPANIFVMIDGSVRLGDFGLARDLTGDYYAKEEGTKVYMAAEVFMFKRTDYNSDIFSVGIVTQELLTGRHPYQARSEQATIDRIKVGTPDELPDFVPREMKKLVTAMLSHEANKRPSTQQIMEQDTIKMYLRMQEEKEKQQNEITLLRSQLSKQQTQSNTYEPKPITVQQKQQTITTQPKVASQPKIIAQPPVIQQTVTSFRKGPIPHTPQIPCLEDTQVDRDTFTSINSYDSTIQFDPVIKKGIIRFEVLNLRGFQRIGIADESVRYGRNEHPGARGRVKIVIYYSDGDIHHFGHDYIKGNAEFKNIGDRIALELNMDSNPGTLTFFVNDVEQMNFVTNIPSAVRVWAYLRWKDTSFKVLKFEQISEPVAKHGEGSRQLEYGTEQ